MARNRTPLVLLIALSMATAGGLRPCDCPGALKCPCAAHCVDHQAHSHGHECTGQHHGERATVSRVAVIESTSNDGCDCPRLCRKPPLPAIEPLVDSVVDDASLRTIRRAELQQLTLRTESFILSVGGGGQPGVEWRLTPPALGVFLV